MGGTGSPFSSLPILQMLMAHIIFCCNVHVTMVEGDLKELPRSLVCILLSIAQIALNRLQFSPLLYINTTWHFPTQLTNVFNETQLVSSHLFSRYATNNISKTFYLVHIDYIFNDIPSTPGGPKEVRSHFNT